MTHILHTNIKTKSFANDDYRVYLTRDLTWTVRNVPNERTPLPPESIWGEGNLVFDPALMARLSTFVKSTNWAKDSGTMWGSIVQQHQFFLDWMRNGELEKAHEHLNLMHQSPLMIGISQGSGETEIMQEYQLVRYYRTLRTWDVFLGVMEYCGLIGPQNHEQGATHLAIPIEAFIKNMPTEIVPPRWQGGLWGLKTSRGIFGDRDLMSLYIALRIKEKYSKETRILEIGGGAGYTAYWLHKFGFTNLFMVDIPSVAVCQAYQLAANIGAENISLPHESREAAVKFISPEQIPHRIDKFDLVVNCDSMPEMDKESLNTYLDFITTNARAFYSINQESRGQFNKVDQHVVRSVIKNEYSGRFNRIDRCKFWLRDGYAEEWYITQNLDKR
jgi:hypothetical protein